VVLPLPRGRTLEDYDSRGPATSQAPAAPEPDGDLQALRVLLAEDHVEGRGAADRS